MITRHNFRTLFKEAFDIANKPITIIKGLYPYETAAVDYTKCICSRRNELFAQRKRDKVTDEDYNTCLKALHHFLGERKNQRLDTDCIEDDMYRFLKHCMLETKERKNTHTESSNDSLICPEANIAIEDLMITDSFLTICPQKQRVLYSPTLNEINMDLDNTTNLTDKTSTDTTEPEKAEHYVQDCKDILNKILESVWSAV